MKKEGGEDRERERGRFEDRKKRDGGRKWEMEAEKERWGPRKWGMERGREKEGTASIKRNKKWLRLINE